ncbi:MAG: cytochrome c oxidase assembly protein [Pseudomonadota bacterium]|nr:cytochrome c oxidase assembly protein [Pseudomonadota bacterium]
MNGATHAWHPYCGAAPVPGELLGRWNFDPLLLLAVAALAIGWQIAIGRRHPDRSMAFYAATGLVLILFVTPFCALTSALFSARVVHHVLLTAALAPLLVLSLPRTELPRVGSLAAWTALQAVIFWVWHAPPLYSAALSSHAIYWLMQLSILGCALGFWAAIRRASAPAAVGALLVTLVQMGLLGALITFAATALYEPHFGTTAPWGFLPLEDQQLGGLVMWAPAAGFYLAAALVIAGKWLKAESRAAA